MFFIFQSSRGVPLLSMARPTGCWDLCTAHPACLSRWGDPYKSTIYIYLPMDSRHDSGCGCGFASLTLHLVCPDSPSHAFSRRHRRLRLESDSNLQDPSSFQVLYENLLQPHCRLLKECHLVGWMDLNRQVGLPVQSPVKHQFCR